MKRLRAWFNRPANPLHRALKKGDVAWLDAQLDAGADPVTFYNVARGIKKPSTRALDRLEKEIEDIALHPGTHVPRHADWKIKRAK